MPEAKETTASPYPVPRSFRLDATAREYLELLQNEMGVSQADVVRLAIRGLAEQRGVKLKKNTGAK